MAEDTVAAGAFAWARKQAEAQRGSEDVVVGFRKVRRLKWLVEVWDRKLGTIHEQYTWTERGARRVAYRLARILKSNNFV